MSYDVIHTTGDLFYARPLYAFLSFGVFSILIQYLIVKGFFEYPVIIGALYASIFSAAMPWAALVVDTFQYDLPWYYGLIEPFAILFNGNTYQNFGFILGLALPTYGIIAISLSSIIIFKKRYKGLAMSSYQENSTDQSDT